MSAAATVATLDLAIGALRAGDPARAEALLAAIEDPTLSPALHARILALRAQALLGVGRTEEAGPLARQALAAARGLGDAKGVEQVRALHAQIYAARSAEMQERQRREEEQRAASAPLEALLAEANSPAERVMAMVRKVNALAEAGTPDVALGHATVQAALALGQAPREQVLALLALARAEPPGHAHYEQALAIADEADETALVGAVTRAARAAGIAFQPIIFGS